MKAITIRGIEPDLSERLKCKAKNDRKSVNQFILDMIKKDMGMHKEKKYSRKYDDLDHLFGKWTDSEFEKIQGTVDNQRKIDMELWE